MDELSDSEHVGRYCSQKRVAEDGRITAEAFKLWPRDKGYLSVNWLEKIAYDRPTQITGLRHIYRSKIKGIQTGAKIACLNVGLARTFVQEHTDDNKILRFIAQGTVTEPSYAGIHGLDIEDDIVFELLAQSVNQSYDF
jgi:hypothetical protein